MSKDTITYHIWPCGSYVEASEYDEGDWSFMGDDYRTIKVNANIEEASDEFWEIIMEVTK